MAFKEVASLLSGGLSLPVKGKTYHVPPPSARTGLTVQAIMQAAASKADGGAFDEEVLADAAERDLYADVLGPAHAQMIADGVDWPTLKHAAVTAMVWIIQDEAAAELYWNSGGDPNRLAPNRQTRRASSGTASSTRSRGSGSSTTRRQGNRGGKRRPARG
ncbi:DUF7426 family protein [Streptomyces sp. NPDC003299]